jgi:serine/threonine-protein kinase
MGRVLLARDPVLNRDVAIKILRDDLGLPPEVREGLVIRMKHEAQAAARVSHPNLVTLHDMGQDPSVGLYLVFECVSGPNLKERIRSGRLPPQQAARLARELGNALSIAHLSGVLHRDVKPENILLSSTGAKITDFGIARIPDSTLTRTGSLIGTPAYCAPEALAAGHFSPESDQFSLAATLYEAVSGERAFPGDDAVGVAAKIQTEEPRPIARRCNLSDEVDEILLRGMCKDPRGRFASTAELGEVLATSLERSTVPAARASLSSLPQPRASLSAIPTIPEVPSIPPPSGTATRTIVGGLTLLVVGGLVGYAASQGNPFLRVTPDLAPYLAASGSAAPPASSEATPSKPPPRPRSPTVMPGTKHGGSTHSPPEASSPPGGSSPSPAGTDKPPPSASTPATTATGSAAPVGSK